jgi:hypothetical protein
MITARGGESSLARKARTVSPHKTLFSLAWNPGEDRHNPGQCNIIWCRALIGARGREGVGIEMKGPSWGAPDQHRARFFLCDGCHPRIMGAI